MKEKKRKEKKGKGETEKVRDPSCYARCEAMMLTPTP